MLCYKDMTFCSGGNPKCSKFGDGENKCPRSLTPKVREHAAKWWGEGTDTGPPIAQFTEPEKLECYTNDQQP